MEKEIDRIEFMKRLRNGEKLLCPECEEGTVSTNYDPETSHFFCCNKCDFMINID